MNNFICFNGHFVPRFGVTGTPTRITSRATPSTTPRCLNSASMHTSPASISVRAQDQLSLCCPPSHRTTFSPLPSPSPSFTSPHRTSPQSPTSPQPPAMACLLCQRTDQPKQRRSVKSSSRPPLGTGVAVGLSTSLRGSVSRMRAQAQYARFRE